MKLAVPPYGQTKRAARHRQMKNNWPEKIISFEAWCAYTYYNPGEGPHGGEKFQKLMNYLLVNGSAWNANTVVELATTLGGKPAMGKNGGPQYTSQEMASFCKDVIDQDFSSPGHANGNGLAENTVKQVKYLLIKLDENWEDFQYALQEWRNTPSHTGYAPSQIFLNRVQRTKLPVLPELCHVNTDNAALGATAKKVALKVKAEKLGGKVLKDLVPGQRVLIQQLKGIGRKPRWDNSGTVVHKNGEHQSYYVDLDTGERLLRNRLYLRELSETENPDLLKEDLIHESVSNLPRRSERIAAKVNH